MNYSLPFPTAFVVIFSITMLSLLIVVFLKLKKRRYWKKLFKNVMVIEPKNKKK